MQYPSWPLRGQPRPAYTGGSALHPGRQVPLTNTTTLPGGGSGEQLTPGRRVSGYRSSSRVRGSDLVFGGGGFVSRVPGVWPRPVPNRGAVIRPASSL